MDTTPNLDLPYIMPAQAQKHVTHNEAIRALDALVQLSVIDRDRTEPPAEPADGDRHIVAAAASGDWAGRDNAVAAFQDGAWAYYAPQTGWQAWIAADGTSVGWDGTAWVAPAVSALQNAAHAGIGTTADDINRLAVASQASLLTHDGAGHQLKINKNTPADTASMLFQSGWSGRAEFGLAGDDDWRVKVSPDGAVWHDVFSVDRHNGAMHLAAPLSLASVAHASLPAAASAGAGAIVFVPDRPGGAAAMVSDGADWLTMG